MKDHKLGEKIRKRRCELGLTQKAVAGDFMTRSMLSIIEAGRAAPSAETAEYLAGALDIPLPYLFSDDEDLFFYEKKEKIPVIRECYTNGDWASCIEQIERLSDIDDELAYVYAFSALLLGRKKLFQGALASAVTLLNKALEMAERTCYGTDEIAATVPLYLSVANNVNAPLLEFDSDTYERNHFKAYDHDFFKYITMDFDYEFENEYYRKHLYAKQLLRKYSYYDAIAVLREIEEAKNEVYNALVLFGVYSDLEIAFRQIGDFENAYRYASKKLTLISAFKQ